MAATVHPFPQQTVIEPWGGYWASEILQRPPPRQWIVDGMIPRKVLTLLAGAPGSAKSKLLLQLCVSTVLGQPWVGRHVEQVKCLGLFLEDDKPETDRRLFDVCEAYETDCSLLDGLHLNPREWLSTKLIEFPRGSEQPKWTPFGEQMWDVIEQDGYGLLIIDTATKAFGWPGRWSGDKASNVAVLVQRECAKRNIAAIVTDHTNKADAGGFAGVNTWLGSVRSRMNLRIPTDEMTRERDPTKRILRNLDSNYGWWDPVWLEWRNDVLVPSTVEPIVNRPRSFEERLELNSKVLTYLEKCVSRGSPVPIDDTDRQSLPQRIRRSQKIPFNDLNAAIDWMLEQQRAVLVKVDGKGMIRPAHLHYAGEEPWRGVEGQ